MKKLFTLFSTIILSFPVFAALPVVVDNGGSSGCAAGSGYSSGGAISNTAFDSYYQSECYFTATSTYTVSDPAILAGNTYSVYLHFAEIYFTADGARVFHVDVEGTRILENFDIHAASGDKVAIAFRYDVVATTNGSIDITFTKVTQNPKISAIEIRDTSDPSTLEPDNGVQNLTTTPFPVEWSEMNITARNQKATLAWSTAWESNNLGFEVQMSRTGTTFETVGFVQGVGTTQDFSSYEFTSEALSSGIYGFRLKQIDMNGRISISPTMELSVGNTTSTMLLSVYPNPATETTMVKYFASDNKPVEVTLRNIVGQQVASFTDQGTGIKEHLLELGTVSPGIYFIQLVSGMETSVGRLVVQ